MWEGIIAVCAVLSPIIGYLVWRLRQEKTKAEKIREVIVKSRAKLARENYNAQIKDTVAMEKDHDQLMADHAAVMALLGKGTPPAK